MRDDDVDVDEKLRMLTKENRDLRQALIRLEQKVSLLAQDMGVVNQRQRAAQASDTCGRNRAMRLPQLPLEVLRFIFTFCLPIEGNAVLSPHEPPLLLGRVCKLWRNLAWSTPELWDSLHIVVPNLDYDPFEHEPSKWDGYIEAIGSWLKCSGTRPLSLSLVDDNPLYFVDEHPCLELVEKVVEQISEQSTRWQHLRVQLRGRDMKSYLNIFPAELPNLETFAFRTLDESIAFPRDDFDYTHANTGFHPITTSPSLRNLWLGDASLLGIYHAEGLTRLAHSNLVELSLGDESRTTRSSVLKIADVVSILTQLQGGQLKACRLVLKGPTPDSFYRPPSPRITLPSLRDFAIAVIMNEPAYPEQEMDDAALKWDLFPLLCFPALRSFEYKLRVAASTFPFLPLLQNTHQLETLKLYTSTYSEPFERLLELDADIKELHLSAELSADFMDLGETAFPNLEILRLDCCPPVDRTQLLQDIDRARNQGREEEWEDVIMSTPEQTLRRLVERKRYSILDTTVAFIQNRYWPDGSRCESDGQSVIHRHSPLRTVDFRLNERLRAKALAKLAPVIEDGLTVSFREDYFNILPPPSYSFSAAQSWNVSPDSY